jgi:phosphate uptake regulator
MKTDMNAGFEQAQLITNAWMQMAVRMMSVGMTMTPDQPPSESQRQMRDATLSVMGEQTDAYLRSPPFLGMMKQSLDASIAVKRQLNELFTQAQHSVEGVARQDVDTLLLSVSHMERRVLDRIENLCERLETVSRRLDAMESFDTNGNGHTRPERAPAASDSGEE